MTDKKRPSAPNPGEVAGLANKSRPTSFGAMVGNQAARTTLEGLFRTPEKTPHAFAFVGPPGTGKTTAARISAAKFGATELNHCYQELDIADLRGIDDMRKLKWAAARSPLGGGTANWFCLDEFQMATREAQNILLKLLEDPPRKSYFVICTTDPHKIIPAVMSRCTVVKFEPCGPADIRILLGRVARLEKFDIDDKLCRKIIEVADGSPRKALVLLEQAMPQAKVADQIATVVKGDTKAQSIELCKALIAQADWKAVATILRNLTDDPEAVRRHVLGYANACLLNGMGRAYLVIRAFQYDLFASGKAGLTAACWEARGAKA